MGKLNATSISDYEAKRARRAEELKVLTSTPFNLGNSNHTKALKSYIDSFEFSANQMYLFQGLSAGLTDWKGMWLIGFVLPLPDFAKYLLTQFLYINVVGWLLESYSMTDFNHQLKEMKTIYNWCLKGGQENYSSAITNADNLSYPDIQRLVKVMAPLTSTEFMLAWPRETQSEKPGGGLSRIFSTTYNIASSAYSLFVPSSSKPNLDQNRVHDLKVGVETHAFDVGAFTGFEQAIKYFATSKEFRAILSTKIQQPVEALKNMIPTPLKAVLSPS